MPHIRRISVHVDEPDPGHFYWVLMEEGDDASQWRELGAAEAPFEQWIDALTAGMAELIGYAPDKSVGPRAPGEDEDGSPVAAQFLS